MLQAALALFVIERFRELSVYPFALFPAFNRFFSLLLGGFSRQDEARISVLLGLGTYAVAIPVLAMLLSIVVRCSCRLNIGARTNAYMITVSTACQLIVIGTYEYIKV